jgi:hypothetical protein
MSSDVTATIAAAKFAQLRSDQVFVAAMTLARATNALRFTLGGILSEGNRESAQAMRARFAGGLQLAAAAFEALHALRRLSPRLEHLSSFAPLRALNADPLTRKLTSGFLKTARNKVTFHFLSSELQKAMRLVDDDVVSLARRDGDFMLNIHYPLVDYASALFALPEPENVPSRDEIALFERTFPGNSFMPDEFGDVSDITKAFMLCTAASVTLSARFCGMTDALLAALLTEWQAKRA